MNLKVKVAADAERREGIGAALSGSTTRGGRSTSGGRGCSRRCRRRTRARRSCAAALDGTRVDLERLAQDVAAAREELSRARAEHEGRAVASRARDAEARELRTRVEAARGAMGEAALTGREQALALTHLEEQTRERCQAELKWEVSAVPPRAAAGRRRARASSRSCGGRWSGWGRSTSPPSRSTRSCAKRYEFLADAEEGPRGSLEQLKEAIAKIDRDLAASASSETFDVREREVPGGLPAPVRRRARRARAHRRGGRAGSRAWRSSPSRRARSCRA